MSSLIYLTDDATNLVNTFNSDTTSENLPSYSSSSINSVGDLLDLEVDAYSLGQNYPASNVDATIFENALIPSSSGLTNSLNSTDQNTYIGLSSDLISLPSTETDPFFLVSMKWLNIYIRSCIDISYQKIYKIFLVYILRNIYFYFLE